MVKNAANLLVLLRTVLVFPTLAALSAESETLRGLGVALLVAVFLLDGVDGWVARRLRTSTLTGGLLDTLGDRITENLLFVFFAWKRLVPLAVPLVFIARSFASDFVRSLLYRRGVGTFGINTSRLGRLLVASRTSRAAYLAGKFAVFLLGGVLLWREPAAGGPGAGVWLRPVLWWAALAVTAANVVRFALLVYDSREVLREELRA
ncbi:MAG TPA: CDP-alcohol phosphatidyltransferase family protein [bacterium]